LKQAIRFSSIDEKQGSLMVAKRSSVSLSEPSQKASTSRFEEIASLAKALAHPARIRIVETLLRRQTCIGCDIVEEIGLAASTTSEHLRILKAAGIIIGEIAAPRVCYSLNPVSVAPLSQFLKILEAGSPPALSE
jgi:ArsR family transcriptional regulator, arsenate/arsenite/antimonite-responsive transcriptional repressor